MNSKALSAACRVSSIAILVLAAGAASGQPGTTSEPPIDWKTTEAAVLTQHVQLTTRDRFVKAGEAYFSPEGTHIIFQAVPVPEEGKEPDPFYAMYVARLGRDATTGAISGLEEVVRISPPDTANTCGWFHPKDKSSVIFGSTQTRPSDEQKSGFQVGSRRYVWMFPQEMEIVTTTSFSIVGGIGASSPMRGPARNSGMYAPLFSLPNYDAECSFDASGRFVLYAHIESQAESAKPDANIYVFDTKSKQHHPIVIAGGYDGGPFFSPNDGFICYRSDRKGDDLLQLFIADLKHTEDAEGVNVPTGIDHEWQITDNGHVNWCPYWHPSGEFIVYASSEIGHGNYEVFAIETPVWALRNGSVSPANLRRMRITEASGADVLPAFSPDGSLMMWTSQRGPKAEGEGRSSSQLWIARWNGGTNPLSKLPSSKPSTKPSTPKPAAESQPGGGTR